jgi:bis(5'-adenosyl)-triphosphatase
MNPKLGSEVIFGHCIIPQSQIFLSRKNVFAMVNHRPFLPGHVLVCSRRNVEKLNELTEI